MLNGLTMKSKQPNMTERDGEAEGGVGCVGQQRLCRICLTARKSASLYTLHNTVQCGSLSAWDRRELYTALQPYGGAGHDGQQVLCRVCQAARMPASSYTSHSTAQCGALSAWDWREIQKVLQVEYGQVELEEIDNEGQESQLNSA